MTRINSGIPIKNLTDEHLLAEHREIKRIPAFLKASLRTGSIRKIPRSFRLGKGHVLFFLDKFDFCYTRYLKIKDECKRRGFDVTDYSDNFLYYSFLKKYWKTYIPGESDILAVKERIRCRILGSPKKVWHYYGKPIEKEEAIKLLER